MSHTPTNSSEIALRLGPAVFRVGAGGLWMYVWLVAPLGSIFGTSAAAGGVLAAGVAAIIVISRMRLFARRLLDFGLVSLVVLLMMFSGDFVMTVRDNWRRFQTERFTAAEARTSDSNVWHGELYPRMYIPPGQSFFLYKPNVRLTADTFGERYMSSMLASPTLVTSVLERRRLSYFIGPEGLRELEPLSESRIFALGDSFVFGYATDEGKTWPDLLGAALGEPVYNLGVSATGPRAQVDSLAYLLRTHRGSMRVQELLWMIFEGNDLENSYDPASGGPATAVASALLEGTVLEPIVAVPERIRRQSMIGKMLRGEFGWSRSHPSAGHYRIDGVDIPFPVFHSTRFGYRLFSPADIQAATASNEYVRNHPNRPRLDQTFREMQGLSRENGFTVTVVIAPSDARVYGAAFEDFPALSPEPYFVDYVARLAAEMKFDVVNLLPLLRPIAATELLYYRDDHHWNERGNEVVAQLIRAAVSHNE